MTPSEREFAQKLADLCGLDFANLRTLEVTASPYGVAIKADLGVGEGERKIIPPPAPIPPNDPDVLPGLWTRKRKASQ